MISNNIVDQKSNHPQYYFPFQQSTNLTQNDARKSFSPIIINESSRFTTQSQPIKTITVDKPALPSLRDVYVQIDKIVNELQMEKMNLSILEKRKEMAENGDNSPHVDPKSFNIDTYKDFKIDKNLINTFKLQNKMHISRSHTKSQVPNRSMFRRLLDLPQYRDMLILHNENLSVLFSSIYGNHKLNHSRNEMLVKKYLKYQENQRNYLEPAIDSFNLREHNDDYIWGEEQVPESTIPFEGPLATVGVGPDIEQQSINSMVHANLFNDMNNFVEDPKKAHEVYKKRVYWSENDRVIFYDLFMSKPHQFREISKHFLGKTTKDMIEFYYTTKSTFDFDAARAARNKKNTGRKKKVITEGVVKRH